MMKSGGYTGDAEEASSAWEKCSRTILLNSKVEILDLLELLQKLCMNIISNADDLKYRTIKLNNKTIQNRLLSRKGGLEFLSAIGFRTVIIDGVKNLQLDIGDADRTLKFDEIEDSLSWLISTVNTCVHIAEESLRPPSESCAECTIQLKLPTGLSVTGGFVSSDPVSAVLSFACCFFRSEKHDSVMLRQAHNAAESISGLELQMSLAELGLSPRAVLVVTVQSDTERTGSFLQAHQSVSADIKTQKQKAEKARSDQIKARKVLEAEKARTLFDFEADRRQVKVRASGMGDENIPTKSTEERAEYRKKAP